MQIKFNIARARCNRIVLCVCPMIKEIETFIAVPCGEGAYLYEDYCKKCDIGYYQHSKGQTSCTQCPEDRSTVGIGATTLDDCTGCFMRPFSLHSFYRQSHVYSAYQY